MISLLMCVTLLNEKSSPELPADKLESRGDRQTASVSPRSGQTKSIDHYIFYITSLKSILLSCHKACKSLLLFSFEKRFSITSARKFSRDYVALAG